MKIFQSDFLVVGSGIAGLNFALKASEIGTVNLITKKKLKNSNTWHAQGGIAAVLSKIDDFDKHIEDTMKAGHYHNDLKAVKFMVENAPQAIKELIEMGVEFDQKNEKSEEKEEKEENGKILKNSEKLQTSEVFNNLELGREGGHSENRIVHVGDYTGKEIEEMLVKKIKEKSANGKKIQIFEDCFAVDLIIKEILENKLNKENKECLGIEAIKKVEEIETIEKNQKNKETKSIFLAQKTILCTGGSGQAFKTTTNPKIATGDGLAMAIRANAEIKDLQYYQFHPTAFKKPKQKKHLQNYNSQTVFLISEALRGEGAVLINQNKEKFMEKVHPQKDLAPRDIVTKAIQEQQKLGNKVFLTFTKSSINKENSNSKQNSKSEKYLKKRFPKIYQELQKYNLNLAKDLVPITPAAHYQCGGIKTDLRGQTSVKNLYAFGEVACTGVHGANRLASNSLLEALVFSNSILNNFKNFKPQTQPRSQPKNQSINQSKTQPIAKPIKELEDQKIKSINQIERENLKLITKKFQKYKHLRPLLKLPG